MIREHATVLLALFNSKKEDGTSYSYAEMLTLVGLSATRDWVRALSKFFVANGKRRKVEYTWKRDEIPAAETLPGVLDADDGDYGVKDEIAAALNRIANDLIVIAKAAGLPGYRIISIDDPSYEQRGETGA